MKSAFGITVFEEKLLVVMFAVIINVTILSFYYSHSFNMHIPVGELE